MNRGTLVASGEPAAGFAVVDVKERSHHMDDHSVKIFKHVLFLTDKQGWKAPNGEDKRCGIAAGRG